MKCVSIWLLLLLFTQLGQTVSIFPNILVNAVAATPQREVARGMAHNGTNILVVFQGDSLYNGPNVTNQLAGQLMSPAGVSIGNRIDLALNGSVPLVEFGRSNFLVAWTASDSKLQGQRLDPSGQKSGTSFTIVSNSSAIEVGTLTFAMDQFWMAWVQTNSLSTDGIRLQRVSEAGENLGEALAVGSPDSPSQFFPVLSAGRTNLLVAWVAQRPGTNAWDVVGRFVDTNGHVSDLLMISQTPSLAPYPVAAAFDGTNHFVLWSREDGPKRYVVEYYFAPVTITQFPAIFGRLVNENGALTEDLPISSCRFGQIAPSIVFDGTNYLLAWNDRRYAHYIDVPPDDGEYEPHPLSFWQRPATTNQTMFFAFRNRAGQPVDWEFIGEKLDTAPRPPGSYPRPIPRYDFDRGAAANTGPMLRRCGESAVVLHNRRSENGQTNDVFLTSLVSPQPDRPEVKITVVTNGPFISFRGTSYVRISLPSTNTHFIPQWSSNAVDWITPVPNDWIVDDPYTSPNDFIDLPWPTTEYTLNFSSGPRFYRGVEDACLCKSLLRRVARHKEIWARQNNMKGSDTPLDDGLWTSVSDKPICPSAGSYYRQGAVNDLPECFVPFHQLP